MFDEMPGVTALQRHAAKVSYSEEILIKCGVTLKH